MADIPRYNAQISQISVPSLQNFQQDQNEQIYKAVAGIANDTADVAVKLYAAEKEYEATVEGGKVTKETDLNNLPTPTTRAQQAYNDAAIAAFYTDFSVDAERKINEAAFKNQDNPAQFLVETDAYLNGVAENIPDHLKKQILRPVQMARESKYDTLLKHKTTKNQQDSVETFKFNMWQQRKNANYIANDMDLDNYFANAEKTAQMLIQVGGKSEDAIKYMEASYEDGLNRYLAQYFFKEKINPTQYQTFFKNVQMGKTGIKYLDMMPPERRINIAMKAFNDWNSAENTLAEKNATLASNKEAMMNIQVLNSMSDEDFSANNEAYGVGYANQNIEQSLRNIENGTETISTPGYAEKAINGAKYGALTLDDLIEMKNLEVLGERDFLEAAKSLNGFAAKNRELPEYSSALQLIMNSNPHITNDFGEIVSTNEKQTYLIDKLGSFLDSRKVTGAEITEFVNNAIKEADASFKGQSEYKNNFTKEKMLNSFGAKYDEINDMAKKHIYGNSINRGKLKKEVMQKYKVSSERANAILTYWNNIRKMEAGNGR